MSNVTAYYPVKAFSERVPGKNLRLFNGRPLFTIVLDMLQSCECISGIVVDTDSPEVNQYAERLPKTSVVHRAAHLRGNHVNMNQLLSHFLSQTEGEHFLQTHATNPLLSRNSVEAAVKKYFGSLPAHDSLLSVNRFQNRFYDGGGKPLNHTLAQMERTQDMEPLYEENSLLFIFSRTSFTANGNSRIGKKPMLFETPRLESIDIDREDDFRLAELVEQIYSRPDSRFISPR